MSCMQHHFSSGRSSRKARKPEREGREGRRWPFDQLGVLSRGCRRLGREGGKKKEWRLRNGGIGEGKDRLGFCAAAAITVALGGGGLG
ncbi:hypothetical protein BHM03_00000133 [Ensete ventricosum]|nr:hypothetical protein BHM03_00000133 [Ensete ventricosum]